MWRYIQKKIHTWFFLLTIEFACQRHNDWICLSKDKSRSVYSLEGFASPGLRSQLHKSMNIHIMPIVFPLDTQINHILISTGPNLMSLQYLIQHVKKIKSKKQNLISIYIYIYIHDWWWYVNIENWKEYLGKCTPNFTSLFTDQGDIQ